MDMRDTVKLNQNDTNTNYSEAAVLLYRFLDGLISFSLCKPTTTTKQNKKYGSLMAYHKSLKSIGSASTSSLASDSLLPSVLCTFGGL